MVDITNKAYCPICSKPYMYLIESLRENRTFSDNPVYLKFRKGPYGRFMGCANFPKCNYSYSLEPKKPFIDWEDELRPY